MSPRIVSCASAFSIPVAPFTETLESTRTERNDWMLYAHAMEIDPRQGFSKRGKPALITICAHGSIAKHFPDAHVVD
jgi:hypothetical protein